MYFEGKDCLHREGTMWRKHGGKSLRSHLFVYPHKVTFILDGLKFNAFRL
jgi:hypothetical protein